MEYSVDYFIEKFSATPDDKWCIYDLTDEDGRHCALGWCGVTNIWELTKEGNALRRIFHPIRPAEVNNGGDCRYSQDTPKVRILAALYDIKRQQEPEFNIPPMTVDDLVGQGEIVNQ